MASSLVSVCWNSSGVILVSHRKQRRKGGSLKRGDAEIAEELHGQELGVLRNANSLVAGE